MKDGRIAGYFDTKYMTIPRIEQILHNFKDQKFANFFNREQVNFRVTLVTCTLLGMKLTITWQMIIPCKHSGVNL